MEIITTQSKGNDFVEVDQEFLLDETPKTKTVFKAAMHPGGIRGDIIRYRKDANGNGGDLVPVNFNSLHESEGIKITLPTEAIKLSNLSYSMSCVVKTAYNGCERHTKHMSHVQP